MILMMKIKKAAWEPIASTISMTPMTFLKKDKKLHDFTKEINDSIRDTVGNHKETEGMHRKSIGKL